MFVNKIDTFSRYGQQFLTAQIRSTIFNFDNVFKNINVKEISRNKELIKTLGIKKIGKSKDKGITFFGQEYYWRVFLSKDNSLNVELLDKYRRQVVQKMSFDNTKQFVHTGSFSGVKIEELMTKAFDEIEGALLNLIKLGKTNASDQTISKIYTPEDIAKINEAVAVVPKIQGIQNAGCLDNEHMNIVHSLIERYQYLKKIIKKIPNPTSRNNVKKSYKNYECVRNTKMVAFKNIGPSGEDISLFPSQYNFKTYLSVTVRKPEGNNISFVITPEGKIQKNLPFIKVSPLKYKHNDIIPEYLTQKEIDELDIMKYLQSLDKELKLYSLHMQKWLKEQKIFKKNHKNRNVASLEQFNDIIENIRQNFINFKKNIMRKLYRSKEVRNDFKRKNNISDELTTSSITFTNITEDGKDIRLSFPKILNKIATQILVMYKDNVEKSFYIFDQKLLKFNIKKKSDRLLHYDRQLYFHDKNYLEKSNLGNYLNILKNKLSDVNEKLMSESKK